MNPREVFELARRALDVGDWATAQKLSKETSAAMLGCDYAVRRSKATGARNSIIVVSHQHSSDLIDQLMALQVYVERPDYELVLVNNGNPHLTRLVDELDLDCTLLDIGFNYGASGGRNIGAAYARGGTITFVDDDGVLAGRAIEALVDCQNHYRAVAVRGKIVPKTSPSLTAAHYDIGSRIVPSLPDTEGLSIWDRKTFLDFGGFDPLLYGHEGLLLACRMYRFHGPRNFLYTPHAVLSHDYYRAPWAAKEKSARYLKLYTYLDYCGVPWREVRDAFRKHQSAPELAAAFISTSPKYRNERRTETSVPISILTTARNGSLFIDDFSQSLRKQTHQNFELVFVDDGSSDGTADAMAALWGTDPRFRCLTSRTPGRGGALQAALEAATYDVCVIADIDDISVPQRLEWTGNYFASHPTSSCCSFYCFNESSAIRLAKPFNIDLMSIKARSLIGMPASFPTFAFRKQDFPAAFDASLRAGIDCDWVFRNLTASTKDGHFIPLPAVYYRVHDAQITVTKRAEQREQAIKSLMALHEALLSTAGLKADRALIGQLSRWSPIRTEQELNRVCDYAYNLMSVADQYPGCPPDQARAHMFSALKEMQQERGYRRGRQERRFKRYLTKGYWSRKQAKSIGKLGFLKDRLVQKIKALS